MGDVLWLVFIIGFILSAFKVSLSLIFFTISALLKFSDVEASCSGIESLLCSPGSNDFYYVGLQEGTGIPVVAAETEEDAKKIKDFCRG